MFRAADIKIDRHPIRFFFLGAKALGIMRIEVAEIVPAGTRPLRHSICFAAGRTSAVRTHGIYPFGNFGKRAFSRVGRGIAVRFRKSERQIFFVQRNNAAFSAMHQRDRLPPVPLPTEHPVAELIVNSLFSEAVGSGIIGNTLDSFPRGKTGKYS